MNFLFWLKFLWFIISIKVILYFNKLQIPVLKLNTIKKFAFPNSVIRISFHIVYNCKTGTISTVTSAFIQEADDLESNGRLEEARDSQWIEEQLASSNE